MVALSLSIRFGWCVCIYGNRSLFHAGDKGSLKRKRKSRPAAPARQSAANSTDGNDPSGMRARSRTICTCLQPVQPIGTHPLSCTVGMTCRLYTLPLLQRRPTLPLLQRRSALPLLQRRSALPLLQRRSTLPLLQRHPTLLLL